MISRMLAQIITLHLCHAEKQCEISVKGLYQLKMKYNNGMNLFIG